MSTSDLCSIHIKSHRGIMKQPAYPGRRLAIVRRRGECIPMNMLWLPNLQPFFGTNLLQVLDQPNLYLKSNHLQVLEKQVFLMFFFCRTRQIPAVSGYDRIVFYKLLGPNGFESWIPWSWVVNYRKCWFWDFCFEHSGVGNYLILCFLYFIYYDMYIYI